MTPEKFAKLNATQLANKFTKAELIRKRDVDKWENEDLGYAISNYSTLRGKRD